MKIIGAGLSGLLCGALNPGSTIYEKQSELPNNHGAILRFRSDKIARALGIPFKEVRVTKCIWYDGEPYAPCPQIQNLYSNKVTGEYTSRSIDDISPVTRYIAPGNFIDQLARRCKIEYGVDWPPSIDELDGEQAYVSTMPMPVMMNIMAMQPDDVAFHRQSIWTATYEFPKSVDLYQTIYFPGPETRLYRASFTGNHLICEYIDYPGPGDMSDVLEAFGLRKDLYTATPPLTKKNKYGKIIDIDRDIRRSIMSELTHNHNIYSLGRFATWRNILLDDVYEDIFKIRDLMNLDHYSRRLKIAEEN